MQLSERLNLTFKTAGELNKIIDEKLPSRPKFTREEVIVQGEVFEVYFRPVMECIKALYSDPELAPFLVYAPERHYADPDQTMRMYHDMHTGKWWWSTQVSFFFYVSYNSIIDRSAVIQKALDKEFPGRTVLPIIISSDKTQVTVFRNKSAYPIYITIGNIPKEIRRKPSRRAYILLGYLPTSRLEHITNKASRRRTLGHLFHACMSYILSPLERAGSDGEVMSSGDGVRRHVHPIFASFVGDYPEQILVSCCITGDCAECEIPKDDLGEDTKSYPLRNLMKILQALSRIDEGPVIYMQACKDAGIKPIFDPFWQKLPYSHVYQSITPDILHQLYQGVLKHLKNWIIEAYGPIEIDARCRRMPPNHNIRVFMKGISSLSRVTGQEHDQIARFLLGLVIELPLPDGMSNVRLVRALRAMLDFLFLSQYPVHTDATLNSLHEALERFHENKAIFVDLGIRKDFKIPKLHFMNHYVSAITLFGTLDNFNTEYTERLHIDLAKDAYRATNHKDEYSQMTQWLERKEKIQRHGEFVKWRLMGSPTSERVEWITPGLNDTRELQMTKWPSKSEYVDQIENLYGATFFKPALARYIAEVHNPSIDRRRLDAAAAQVYLPDFNRLSVYHRIKWIRRDPVSKERSTADSLHVQPARIDKKRGHTIPGRFDTAFVKVKDEGGDMFTQSTCKLILAHEQTQGLLLIHSFSPSYCTSSTGVHAAERCPGHHLPYHSRSAEANPSSLC